MKHSVVFLTALVSIASLAQAQFTIVPRAGIELSNTRISMNDGSFSKLLPTQFNKHFSVRIDYQIKNSRNGVFAGFSTTNSAVELTNANTGKASAVGTQLRIEAGYQYNSYFSYPSKSSSAKGNKNSKATGIRFQDQFGFAYVPSVKKNSKSFDNSGVENYTNYAGNWNLAFIAAWGIEISKGNTKFLSIGLQYLKGLTNLGDRSFSTNKENLSLVTEYSSRASSWSLNVGVPISFERKK